MAAAVADGFMDDTALQQLRRFIVQGYLKIEPATSKEVQNDARSIRAKILSCPMDVPNPLYHSLKSPSGDAAGNNLLHVAHSEMIGKSFLDSPELVDTLSNLLGLEYRVHPHSRTHLRDKGAETTMWHVDIHKGAWSSQRYHEPHYVIVSYYPQDTTIDMGPTEILPGSQYYRCDHDLENFNRGSYPNLSSQISGWATIPQAFTCKAGTIMVMHYDLWHRALQCTKESSNRLMLKFVAYRTKKPGSCILKYNRLPPFELAFFTDQNMDDLSNNPLLDFLNKKP